MPSFSKVFFLFAAVSVVAALPPTVVKRQAELPASPPIPTPSPPAVPGVAKRQLLGDLPLGPIVSPWVNGVGEVVYPFGEQI
ncbi:hypothetical protein CONPUDRAFT_159407 [Coniophora puteana RWD-64-598 SS2]|uniref:Uncharacterized protein n=1 Tax=Coniophora puteana (strain RWD-64-598) TaxID=741705 RepID=A0A5M3M9E3_CONPW|nr:uncharacterized protein CONPUDRAFT_159407 [Coniophora puteana RWD-64-598 SS2]EIW75281.1 hypothetical protein CONPUDRAFT_159407 [Coniophora puteana RWD-64-598 SS2]